MNSEIESNEMEEEGLVVYDEDGYETESMHECGDEIYAEEEEEDENEELQLLTANRPLTDRNAQKSEPFLCYGVITPCFDMSEAWDDWPRNDGRGPHRVPASAAHPKSVTERGLQLQGRWQVKHTMCNACFRKDKKHQKEESDFRTSGLSAEAYYDKLERKRYGAEMAKERRDENRDSAKKRLKTITDGETTLTTPKAAPKTAPKEDMFVTPVKSRAPSSAPPAVGSTSSNSQAPVSNTSSAASSVYKSSTLEKLRAGLASARKASSEAAGAPVRMGTSSASASTPSVVFDLTAATSDVEQDGVNPALPAQAPVPAAAAAVVAAEENAVAAPVDPPAALAHAPPAAAEGAAQDAPPADPAAVAAVPAPAADPAPAAAAAPTTAQLFREQLTAWTQAMRTHLKVSELKDLCRANKLMVSGSKAQLVLRLMKCKFHGSPGLCLQCRQPKMECEYPNDDMLALPVVLRCKHMRGQRIYCHYVVEVKKSYFLRARQDPRAHAVPLVDTPDGVLHQWNISTGSLLA